MTTAEGRISITTCSNVKLKSKIAGYGAQKRWSAPGSAMTAFEKAISSRASSKPPRAYIQAF